MKRLMNKPTGRDTVQFDAEMKRVAHEREAIVSTMKQLQDEKARCDAEIIGKIGEAGWGYVEDGHWYRYALEGKTTEVHYIREPSLVLRRMKEQKS
jgi:hypothetical protein